MIFGPQYSYPMNRIQPIDPDHQDGDQKDGKKKRVQYQGRAWAETDEDLPVLPTMSTHQTPQRNRHAPEGMYADKALLDRAQAMFQKLTTLEEKAAQLCFLVTDAIYDTELQQEVELLIQAWQIGGILFHKGEYRRQAYLVERFQQLSKTPLLLANDFNHGLSFYLQGDALNPHSEQHYLDLGKAVMVQNRRLGIHIQFDRERGEHSRDMSEEQAKAFRKGIRNAHGIVGKEKSPISQESQVNTIKGGFSLAAIREGVALTPTIQESVSFKTLNFFDGTSLSKENIEPELLEAFKNFYDVFLFSGNITDAIRAVVQLVDSGRLSEAALDRHVMKSLIVKSYFFK